MFKPVVVDLKAFTSTRNAVDESFAAEVFKTFHGFYGSLFLSKFSTGLQDEKGHDRGIHSAKTVWATALQRFDAATVGAALDACQALHPKYPPTMPEFVGLCVAHAPRVHAAPAQPRIEMGQALRSAYAAKCRAINAKHAEAAAIKANGYRPWEPTLTGLYQGIAQAVALAGGDEVKFLRGTERTAARKEAA